MVATHRDALEAICRLGPRLVEDVGRVAVEHKNTRIIDSVDDANALVARIEEITDSPHFDAALDLSLDLLPAHVTEHDETAARSPRLGGDDGCEFDGAKLQAVTRAHREKLVARVLATGSEFAAAIAVAEEATLGLVFLEGFQLGAHKAPSACIALRDVFAGMALPLCAGLLPGHRDYRELPWSDLRSGVALEVAALRRQLTQAIESPAEAQPDIKASELKYSDGRSVPTSTLDGWCTRGLRLNPESNSPRKLLWKSRLPGGERVFDRAEVDEFIKHSEMFKSERGARL